jgi:hypothetical protein
LPGIIFVRDHPRGQRRAGKCRGSVCAGGGLMIRFSISAATSAAQGRGSGEDKNALPMASGEEYSSGR